MIELRSTSFQDLESLLTIQMSKVGKGSFSFPADDPTCKKSCFELWNSLLLDSDFHAKTIFYQKQIVGCLMKLIREDKAELFYLLNQNFWKNQIAKKALDIFLQIEHVRPIYMRMEKRHDSLFKIVEKCGFQEVAANEFSIGNSSEFFYCLAR